MRSWNSTRLQLHGHVHEKRPSKIISNQLNLCVEVWDYKPVAEKTILSLLDKASKSKIPSIEPKADF
jgi:calcineurin-like phosphoesterase family protein